MQVRRNLLAVYEQFYLQSERKARHNLKWRGNEFFQKDFETTFDFLIQLPQNRKVIKAEQGYDVSCGSNNNTLMIETQAHSGKFRLITNPSIFNDI